MCVASIWWANSRSILLSLCRFRWWFLSCWGFITRTSTRFIRFSRRAGPGKEHSAWDWRSRLWSYSGYEQLSTVIEEVENPARNFPIGLAIVVPLAVAIYVVTMAAGLAALGNWQEWETEYLVTAARLIGEDGRQCAERTDICGGRDLPLVLLDSAGTLSHADSAGHGGRWLPPPRPGKS